MRLPLVHKLFYTWAGWPGDGGTFPPEPGPMFFENLRSVWGADSIQLRTWVWRPNQIQLACAVEPVVTPVLFTGRMKGRLQHALRAAGVATAFSRKVGMRAIGVNVTAVVEQYLCEQLERSDLADARYRATLAAAAIERPEVNLAVPTETSSGRYWYNLHVVLVAHGRYRIGREDFLARIAPAVEGWAGAGGCLLKALAVMPDHVHVALRGDVGMAPAGVAGGLLAALNRAAGCVLYSDRVYVGTFSEYALDALD